jgi:pimeloyl-ACP methyl ester carboxylesterase
VSATVERSRLAVDGTDTRLLATGAGEASEAVVFVHGNPGSSDD